MKLSCKLVYLAFFFFCVCDVELKMRFADKKGGSRDYLGGEDGGDSREL